MAKTVPCRTNPVAQTRHERLIGSSDSPRVARTKPWCRRRIISSPGLPTETPRWRSDLSIPKPWDLGTHTWGFTTISTILGMFATIYHLHWQEWVWGFTTKIWDSHGDLKLCPYNVISYVNTLRNRYEFGFTILSFGHCNLPRNWILTYIDHYE